MNQIELTNPIANKNAKYLNILNLETLNSSTITSIVDIYKNVPAEIEQNILTMKSPFDERIHPIAIPNGFIAA